MNTSPTEEYPFSLIRVEVCHITRTSATCLSLRVSLSAVSCDKNAGTS
jgi:hypothetical protein